MKKLFVKEIFSSIAGEINLYHQGVPTTFIRLQGCNLRCPYCDTADTQEQNIGPELTINEIIRKVEEFNNRVVCVTGGEPLIQKNTEELLTKLYYEYFTVLETNGTVLISDEIYDACNCIVMDYKFGQKVDSSLFVGLSEQDVIKFVVGSRKDVQEASDFLESIRGVDALIAFSPILDKISPAELFTILQESKVHAVRSAVLSVQLHKLIGLQ